MSFIPSSIGRVPNLLIGRTAISTLNRTNADLFRASAELSTGLRINRPSEDPVAAAAITELDATRERSAQRLRNLELASGNLGILDTALGEANGLARQAQSLALSQASTGPSAAERSSQAVVVRSILESLFRVANRESLAGHVFGGTRPGTAPVLDIGGAYRFVGEEGGLTPDLGLGGTVPVTVGASNAVGAVSSRIEGAVDLRPGLTASTRLSEVLGARGLGVARGSVELVLNGVDVVSVDLSDADTAGDVADRLTSAIRVYEAGGGGPVLASPGPGVEVLAGGFSIATLAGASVSVRDFTGSTAAADLGLTQGGGAFTDVVTQGEELSPLVTARSSVAGLRGLTGPLGEVVLSNNGSTVTVDLSGAQTVGDVLGAIEGAGLGLKARVSDDGRGINVFNTIAAGSERALSISDASDGTGTATALGIRSFQAQTRVADLNFGRGVSVLEGHADPAFNVDFEIVLDDPPGPGVVVGVDLSSSDLTTVGAVVSRINAQIAAALTAAGRPTTDLSIGFASGRNGLEISKGPGVSGTIGVSQRNNSRAAAELGLLGRTFDATTGSLTGDDPARVRVDNLFTRLLDLERALLSNDSFGIGVAAGELEDSADRLTELRALTGGFARRVEDEVRREEDRGLLDETVRSALRDTDFAEAATRFSQLQTQLEAGLRASGISSRLSLLDFI